MGFGFMVSLHDCVLRCNHLNPCRVPAGFNSIQHSNGNQLKGLVRFLNTDLYSSQQRVTQKKSEIKY